MSADAERRERHAMLLHARHGGRPAACAPRLYVRLSACRKMLRERVAREVRSAREAAHAANGLPSGSEAAAMRAVNSPARGEEELRAAACASSCVSGHAEYRVKLRVCCAQRT